MEYFEVQVFDPESKSLALVGKYAETFEDACKLVEQEGKWQPTGKGYGFLDGESSGPFPIIR